VNFASYLLASVVAHVFGVHGSSDEDFEDEMMMCQTQLTVAPSRKQPVCRRQQQKINTISDSDRFVLSPDPTG